MRSPRPSGTVARVRGPTDPDFDAEIEAVTQVGRWEWDIDAGEARWSDQQFRILGLEPRSVTPSLEAFVERIHGDDRARFEGVLDGALANGSALQLMHRIVRPGGEIRTVLSRAQVGRDAAAADARSKSPCHTASQPTPRSAFTRATADASPSFASAASSHPRPSP